MASTQGLLLKSAPSAFEKNPEFGTSLEKKYLHQLRTVATAYEWQNLEYIASKIEFIPSNFRYISKTLDAILLEGDLFSAEIFVKKILPKWEDKKIRSLLEKKAGSLRESFIEKTIDQIDNACLVYDFKLAKELYGKLDTADSKQRAKGLIESAEFKQEAENRISFINKTLDKVQRACRIYDFDLAEELRAKLDTIDAKEKSWNMISSAKVKQKKEIRERFIESTKEEIINSLRVYDFERADSLYTEIETDYPYSDYSTLVHRYRGLFDQKIRLEEFTDSINDLLHKNLFTIADEVMLSANLMDIHTYLNIKVPYVIGFLHKTYDLHLTFEQAWALSTLSTNRLVTARAGSGKTRAITSKAAMLIDCEEVDQDNILILAFNRSAANEINHRMQNVFLKKSFNTAKTFHSLAFSVSNSRKVELITDEPGNALNKKQSKLIQDALRVFLKDNEYLAELYKFLRKEITEAQSLGLDLNEKNHYLHRKDLPQYSLSGELIESFEYKIVADFLFEHNIDYKLNKYYKAGKKHINLDFYFNQDEIEYGIQLFDENNDKLELIRQFCNDNSISLVDLSRDKDYFLAERESVELSLKQYLLEKGLTLAKLPQEILEKKVLEYGIVIDRLTESLTAFIRQAKKRLYTPKSLGNKLENYIASDEREESFLLLALKVFREYETKLCELNKIDFDDLFIRAIDVINKDQGNCYLYKSSLNPIKQVQIKDLRWILIDEFQDFSESYNRLILTLKKYNPNLRFFCVGDDWQAINGFAGSDLTFYNNFTFNMENAERFNMLTNHRSDGKIVSAGNALMKNYGSPANVADNKGDGKITLLYIDDIFVNPTEHKRKGDLPVESEFLIYYRTSNNNSTDKCNFRASRYLKLCYLVCLSPENLGKSITILSRTERISGVSPRYFQKKLFEWIQSDDDELVRKQVSKIKISTIHSYKGLESDIVIIIEATDSMFPKIHPDNNLYNVFGRTALDYLEEERRLFYVGITRAKSAIYFLTETKKVSQFIQTDLAPVFEDPKKIFSRLIPNFEDTIVDEDDDSIPF